LFCIFQPNQNITKYALFTKQSKKMVAQRPACNKRRTQFTASQSKFRDDFVSWLTSETESVYSLWLSSSWKPRIKLLIEPGHKHGKVPLASVAMATIFTQRTGGHFPPVMWNTDEKGSGFYELGVYSLFINMIMVFIVLCWVWAIDQKCGFH